jgi:undecaprenyl pyrophosphate phosphatase UppP
MPYLLLKFIFYTALLWFISAYFMKKDLRDWYEFFLYVAIEMGIGAGVLYLIKLTGTNHVQAAFILLVGFVVRWGTLWLILRYRLQLERKKITYIVVFYALAVMIVNYTLNLATSS